MVKVTRVSKIQLINASRRNMSYQFKNDLSKVEVLRRKSLDNQAYFTSSTMKRHPIIVPSSTYKHNNRVVQNDDQIRSATGNTRVSDLPNIQSPETFGGKRWCQQERHIIWPKWFFFWLTVTIVLGIGAIVTATAVIIAQSAQIPKINWVINGDAETGLCEPDAGITHPTGWSYDGPITQVYYGNPNGDLNCSDPGPSNRGRCYFYGQLTNTTTSMWQRVNISDSINPFLIDNQKIWFNFSAWLGGWEDQDDNAQVSLTFVDRTNQKVGDTVTLGPILAADRRNITSLLFQQTIELVPVGARSFIVLVTITCAHPTTADGDIDNIAVVFYQ